MNTTEFEVLLRKSLNDRPLSRNEARDLKRAFEDGGATDSTRVALRSRAFELAREMLRDPGAMEVVDWLQAVLGAIGGGREQARPTLAEALFSPGDACVRRIIGLLGSARSAADICVFTMTDDRISDAVLAAHGRKVKIRVITDNEKLHDVGSDILRLERSGVPVAVDFTPCHMHHKFAIVDGKVLLTGSYNWTRAAASENEENVVVSDDPRLIAAFAAEFDRLWKEFYKAVP
jgi:phosphatidylserine/phosphatidylglycerophosphate/cardiolipin synthase-like enzyme